MTGLSTSQEEQRIVENANKLLAGLPVTVSARPTVKNLLFLPPL
jgi:hypothetical protein